ncbi:MAG: 2Fe-2S iron-sulfur cluster-binding protein [Nitrospinaceae bacterium]
MAEENLQPRTVEIQVAGQSITAREGETIVHALWAAGLGETVQVGCGGGVCGACTVTIRFSDDRQGGTDLACLRPVEEGMQVFPFPVDSIPPVVPVHGPDAEKIRQSFPTLDRCTKCGACTIACPMAIPVMDSVLRMQEGKFEDVAEDFTTCIHCGLCRIVCEDKVKPHNMGIWVRRSLGMSFDRSQLEQKFSGPASDKLRDDWDYLLTGNAEERLAKARAFRKEGRLP